MTSFFHMRVIVGVVTGLSPTRLLGGLARFVQHPAALALVAMRVRRRFHVGFVGLALVLQLVWIGRHYRWLA